MEYPIKEILNYHKDWCSDDRKSRKIPIIAKWAWNPSPAVTQVQNHRLLEPMKGFIKKLKNQHVLSSRGGAWTTIFKCDFLKAFET